MIIRIKKTENDNGYIKMETPDTVTIDLNTPQILN